MASTETMGVFYASDKIDNNLLHKRALVIALISQSISFRTSLFSRQ
jgi:hypothetical protein